MASCSTECQTEAAVRMPIKFMFGKYVLDPKKNKEYFRQSSQWNESNYLINQISSSDIRVFLSCDQYDVMLPLVYR